MLLQISQSREEQIICLVLFIYSTFKIMLFPKHKYRKKIIKLYNNQYYYNFTAQNSTKNSLLKDYHIKFPSFEKYQILKAT